MKGKRNSILVKIEEAVYKKKFLPKEKERERKKKKKRRMIQIKVLERGPNDVYKATSGKTINGLCSLSAQQSDVHPHTLILVLFSMKRCRIAVERSATKIWLGEKTNTMAVMHCLNRPFFPPQCPTQQHPRETGDQQLEPNWAI